MAVGAFLQGPLLGLSGRIASSIVQHQTLRPDTQGMNARGQTYDERYKLCANMLCLQRLTMTCSSQNAIHGEIGYYLPHPNKGPGCADAVAECAAHLCFQMPIMLPCRFRNFVASSRDVEQLVVAVAVAVCAHAGKVRVDDGLLRGDAARGVVHQQVVEQIEAYIVERGHNGRNVGLIPLGERGLEVGERGDARPVLFAGGAEDAGGC
jgi:hypothetical protein